MTSIRLLWLLLCLLWIGGEIRLLRKTRIDKKIVSESEERTQLILWLTVASGVFASLLFKSLALTPLPIPYLYRQLLALPLFAAGLCLRYSAVGWLGRFFTTHVMIQHDHHLIVEGPYRWVRHPAYAGLLIALAAAGIAMGDLLALMVINIPAYFAVSFRIGIEEHLLFQQFGSAYLDYCKTTPKLLPRLY